MKIPATDHYWLRNTRIPRALVRTPFDASELALSPQSDHEFYAVDVEIDRGAIASIHPRNSVDIGLIPYVDLDNGMLFPCFIDIHTHFDKAHTWERLLNANGTFENALQVSEYDKRFWSVEDIYRRMDFAAKCSYAHGTIAIRSHLDFFPGMIDQTLAAWVALQKAWAGRLTLQAACLLPIEQYFTPEGQALIDQMAALPGGLLGGLVLPHPNLDEHLERFIAIAQERQLPLDLHTDESLDPNEKTLRSVAIALLKRQATIPVVCGHCCSLSVQSEEDMAQTLDLVQAAGIGIVSLPMCNLYLQDRTPQSTPRYRGVTVLHEMRQRNIPVAIASDNCRDGFYAYGDHDGVEVLTQSVRIAHLDHPFGDWCRTVTHTPATMMGLPQFGQIGVNQPADLILFRARNWNELLSRPQGDRVVLRQGMAIDTTLPDYRELDA
jgi:cytosine deaminase